MKRRMRMLMQRVSSAPVTASDHISGTQSGADKPSCHLLLVGSGAQCRHSINPQPGL